MDNTPEHAATGSELLRSGVLQNDLSEYERWRASNADKRVVAKNQTWPSQSFADMDLSHISFYNVELISSSFNNCKMIDTSFDDQCLLSGSKFVSCDLIGCFFKGTQCEQLRLEDCEVSGTDFRGATMNLSRVSDTLFTDVFMKMTNLRMASFSRTSFRTVDMTIANLLEANFEGCTFEDVDLRSANLTSSSLRSCNLADIKFWNAQLGGWSLQRVECSRAYFDEHSDRVLSFEPEQFERLYGGALKVSISYPGGLTAAELLALPIMIETIKRENPGMGLFISNINEVGSHTDVVISANINHGSLSIDSESIRTCITEWFSRVNSLLRSNDRRLDTLNDSLNVSMRTLTELIEMKNKSTFTFQAPVTAGVIGDGTVINGGVDITNSDLVQYSIVEAQASELKTISESLPQKEKEDIHAAIRGVSSEGKPVSKESLSQVAKSIRNICEGIVGNIAAAGILAKLAEFGW